MSIAVVFIWAFFLIPFFLGMLKHVVCDILGGFVFKFLGLETFEYSPCWEAQTWTGFGVALIITIPIAIFVIWFEKEWKKMEVNSENRRTGKPSPTKETG